ncbi:hypothetical protein [Actinokineospora bangkokensis]|uniref:Uncharacterized protein n=1 Tax=Actinokineospora bangkokensis TaxID=1193682 RepID=A0A1Q9LDC8_9PSEU|nr:hypothetical protein [Actinokineospora bangkokensis]OLR90014.1 hypothetical protein BJP25_03270 [Actinokineospora bangkokensis]
MTTLRTAAIAALAGVGVVVLAAWPGDLPVFWAVVLGVPAAAVAFAGARFAGPLEPDWAPLPEPAGTATNPQAATLAGRLAEAAEDPHRFRSRIRPRLLRLADARLLAHGVSGVDDPRARGLLGAELHRLLIDPRAELPPPGRFTELLHQLEDV